MRKTLAIQIRALLLIGAVGLSVFNGILSLGTVLIFSDHERTGLWVSIILPALLWIPALASVRFPKGGPFIFFLIVGASMIAGIDPFHTVSQGWTPWLAYMDRLRFAIVAGLLLLLNAFVVRSIDTQEAIRT